MHGLGTSAPVLGCSCKRQGLLLQRAPGLRNAQVLVHLTLAFPDYLKARRALTGRSY